RDSTNPGHPDRLPFSLQFARLSPYTVMEMLALNDAQTDRYLFAYELAKVLLRDLGIFPQRDVPEGQRDRQEKFLLCLDEFERGYPRLRLSFLLDVVGLCKAAVTKSTFTPYNAELRSPAGQEAVKKRLDAKDMPGSASSWGKLTSVLWRLHRLRVFDRPGGGGTVLDYPGRLRTGPGSGVGLWDGGLNAR